MKVSTDNLLDEISQAFMLKFEAQKLDPAFLQNFVAELFKKVIYANSSILSINNKISKTDSFSGSNNQSKAADTFSAKIKKTFYDLTQDQQYENKFKQFFKRAFNGSNLNALIPSVELNNNNLTDIFDNLLEKNIENKNEQINPSIKELKTDTINTNNVVTNTLKEEKTETVKEQPIVNELKTVTNQLKTEINNLETDREKTVVNNIKTEVLNAKEIKADNIIDRPITRLSKEKNVSKEKTDKQKNIKVVQALPPNEYKKDFLNISQKLEQLKYKIAPQGDFSEGRVDKIKDQPEVILGGITPNGQNALSNVLTPLFQANFKELIKITSTSKKEDNKKEGSGSGSSFVGRVLSTLAAMGIFALIKKGISAGIRGLVNSLKGLGRGVVQAARAVGVGAARFAGAARTLAPAAARVVGPVAAVAGGEFIGGQVGKLIGSNETVSKFLYGRETAGKEAYEKYGTGMLGFGRATYDLYQQGVETAEQEKEHQRMSQERLEKSKESMAGKRQYTPEEETKRKKIIDELKAREESFKKQYEELKAQAWEGWNPFHDEQKETEARKNWESAKETLTIQENKLAEFAKLKPAVQQPQIKEGERPSEPVKVEQLDKSIDLKPIPSDKEGISTEGIITKTETPTDKLASITSENSLTLDKAFDPKQFSLSNDSLKQIVTNTNDTNGTLKVLSEAMFKLATVFDKKITQNGNGNTTIIGGLGQTTQKTTPASIVANSNVDPIRRVRMQFA